MIGQYIQNYRIVSHLGEGGMGIVYKAVDNVLGREVALKMLHTSMIRQAQVLDRFKKEAQVLARLLHPNIAVIYNFIEQEGQFYMVMEYVEGTNLDSLAKTYQSIPWKFIVAMFVQALEGLQHAHKKGIFHRDIKPSNLIVTPEGIVKLMDFGIAKIAGEQKLTQVNRVIGTVEFLAPEIIEGKDPSVASDIYAVGITMYELLSGKLPFESNSDYMLMQDILKKKPAPLKNLNPDLPPALNTIVMKALEKKPENRYTDAKALQQALIAAFPDCRDTDLSVLAQQQKKTPSTILSAGSAALTVLADGRMTVVADNLATRIDTVEGMATKVSPLQTFERNVLLNKKLPYILTGAGVLVLLLVFLFISFGKKKDSAIDTDNKIALKKDSVKKEVLALNIGNNTQRNDPVPVIVNPVTPKENTEATDDKPEKKNTIKKETTREDKKNTPNETKEKVVPVVVEPEKKPEPPKRVEKREILIDDKLQVNLYLREDISQSDDRKQSITFTVTSPVVYNGVTIIQRGAVATGRIKIGRVISAIDFDAVTAANGQQIELKGGDHRKVRELNTDRNYTAIIRKGIRMVF
ncbi:MAG: serine/threonine-protein kinase [Chitinophagaceae bacterium]